MVERRLLLTYAFTSILLGFGEALLNVRAGYRTSIKDDDGNYLATAGKNLTIWVLYGLPKEKVITIEMKKVRNKHFFLEFYYQKRDPEANPFAADLKDRATYKFTDDGMEITIKSLQMNDSGVYYFFIENGERGHNTFLLDDIKPEKMTTTTMIPTSTSTTISATEKHTDKMSTTTMIPTTTFTTISTTEKQTIPTTSSSTTPGVRAMHDGVSSDHFSETKFMILMIFILIMLIVLVVIGIGFFTRKFWIARCRPQSPTDPENNKDTVEVDLIVKKVTAALRNEYEPLIKKGTSDDDSSDENSNKPEDEKASIDENNIQNQVQKDKTEQEDENDDGKPEPIP